MENVKQRLSVNEIFGELPPPGCLDAEDGVNPEYMEAVKKLANAWMKEIRAKLIKYGKNPLTKSGEQQEDKPDHYEVETVLDDGRELRIYFVDWGIKQGEEIAPNARFEISLTPVKEDQFGFQTSALGPEGELNDFRIFFGKPLSVYDKASSSSKWKHVVDTEIGIDEWEQYARLLALIINKVDMANIVKEKDFGVSKKISTEVDGVIDK